RGRTAAEFALPRHDGRDRLRLPVFRGVVAGRASQPRAGCPVRIAQRARRPPAVRTRSAAALKRMPAPAMSASGLPTGPLLTVEWLRVGFPSPGGELLALDGVDLSLGPGEVLGLVGESGAGKSLTGAALSGLV